MNKNTKIGVINRSSGCVGYVIPDMNNYHRKFQAGERKELPFEEVQKIITLSEEKYGATLKDKLGVCLDTCHIWDGGYDIVNHLDDVISDFDRIIGLERLKAIHLNDSMNELASHKDRHEKIGKGKIGFEALYNITRHPALCELPFILETPNEHDGYKQEIQMLKN